MLRRRLETPPVDVLQTDFTALQAELERFYGSHQRMPTRPELRAANRSTATNISYSVCKQLCARMRCCVLSHLEDLPVLAHPTVLGSHCRKKEALVCYKDVAATTAGSRHAPVCPCLCTNHYVAAAETLYQQHMS